MSNVIINPWVFYWMQIGVSLKEFLGFFGLVIGILAAAGGIVIGLNASTKEEIKFSKVCWKIALIGGIMAFIALFIPTEETFYKMIAAKYVTQDVVVKSFDYINRLAQQLINGLK